MESKPQGKLLPAQQFREESSHTRVTGKKKRELVVCAIQHKMRCGGRQEGMGVGDRAFCRQWPEPASPELETLNPKQRLLRLPLCGWRHGIWGMRRCG